MSLLGRCESGSAYGSHSRSPSLCGLRELRGRRASVQSVANATDTHRVIPRRPGQYVRRRYLRLVVPLLFVMGVGIVLTFLGTQWWPLSVLGLGVVLVVYRISDKGHRLDPVPRLKGARGEEIVGHILAELRPLGFIDPHDIDTGHGNIDHIVIGPTGVVVIETKNWAGSFVPVRGHLWHNGRPCPEPLQQARRNAIEVRRRLEAAGVETWVEAVVVSTNATVARGELTFRQASVLQADRLSAWIRTRQ